MKPTHLALAFLLAACFPWEGIANEGSDQLFIYTSRHYPIDETLIHKFEDETDALVFVTGGSDRDILRRIRSEGSSSQADIIIAADVRMLSALQQDGLLTPLPTSFDLSQFPEKFLHPERFWMPMTARARVIFFDKGKVPSSSVQSYHDLTKPEFAGRLCMRSCRHAYNQSLFSSWIEHLGTEQTTRLISGLANNLAENTRGGDTAQIKAIAEGRCDVAIANHYYYLRLSSTQGSHDIKESVGLVYPGQNPENNENHHGSHVNISAIALAKNSTNRALALQYMEFLTRTEHQELLVRTTHEFPARNDIKQTKEINSLGVFNSDDISLHNFFKNRETTLNMCDAVQWK